MLAAAAMQVRIYHNPRCSKSRGACDLLAEKGIKPEVVEYLKQPPTKEELRALLTKLDMKPVDIVRHSEEIYRQEYAEKNLDDEAWLDALIAHPVLIERPIVVVGDKAVIGRPPEKILELL
ncbi:arsenate reductase (glutaredoxin) [Novimethylophilus kurashikiensis]|nr:arsenate reductase (glutaredoxin) [Novimethylophilus kurashikiensis]